MFSTIGAGVPVTFATRSATALVKGWAVEDPTTQMLSRAAAHVVIVAIATARLIAEQYGLISFSLKSLAQTVGLLSYQAIEAGRTESALRQVPVRRAKGITQGGCAPASEPPTARS